MVQNTRALFHPAVEIDFCGHATLASAKLALHHSKKNRVEFITAKQLKVTAVSAGDEINMIFPLFDAIDQPNYHRLN